MSKLKIGTVTHYFPKISVAVLDLVSDIHLNDKISFKGSSTYSQTVKSLQIEHENVEKGETGQDIAIKVDQPVQKGDEVIKEY